MPDPVVFGYQTALQIARYIKNERFSGQHIVPSMASPKYSCGRPTAFRTIPSQPPKAECVQEAVRTLCELYPSMNLSFPLHVLVGGANRPDESKLMQPHSCTVTLPKGSLIEVANGVLITNPCLSYIHETTRREYYDLLMLSYELTGSHQSMLCGMPLQYNVLPLVSTKALQSYAKQNHSLYGSGKASKALIYTSDMSASPRETKLALLLALPSTRGGFGIGVPFLNYEVETTPAARIISGRRTLRCDLYYPDGMIDIEYQSREFHNEDDAQVRDSHRTTAFTVMGYTVFGITDDELGNVVATDVLAESIKNYLGISSFTTIKNYHDRKIRLRLKIGLPIE